MCLSQSCGKCISCRISLKKLSNLLDSVLDGKAILNTLELIKKTSRVIQLTADCDIGHESGGLALDSIEDYFDDYKEHVLNDNSTCNSNQPVACVNLCPANVDISGYIAL